MGSIFCSMTDLFNCTDKSFNFLVLLFLPRKKMGDVRSHSDDTNSFEPSIAILDFPASITSV